MYPLGRIKIERSGNNENRRDCSMYIRYRAHVYRKEKIVNAATELGHEVHIETQGTIGTEDELTAKDIAAADVVIIAADIKVGGRERFKGKAHRRGTDSYCH